MGAEAYKAMSVALGLVLFRGNVTHIGAFSRWVLGTGPGRDGVWVGQWGVCWRRLEVGGNWLRLHMQEVHDETLIVLPRSWVGRYDYGAVSEGW